MPPTQLVRQPARGAPPSDRPQGDAKPWRFARTVAAAERGREERAAETWDRMALPEDVRRALRDRPRFGQRWRQLLRRLTPRPAPPRHRPARTPIGAAEPQPHQRPVSVPTESGSDSTAVVPVPEVLLPAIVPGAHRRLELLALRFWPDGKPDRALSRRRIHALAPAAPGLSALPSIRLRRVGAGARCAGAAAGLGGGSVDSRDRLVRLGRNRRTWFGAAALILIALVGYQTELNLRLGAGEQVREPSHARGQASELRGDSPAALEQYRRASELDPGNPILLYRWAQELEQQGELEQALATYRPAAALSLRARSDAGD